MKLICERDALDRALRFVASRARSKLNIPILQHAKLEASRGTLRITATDLTTRSVATCAAEVAAEGAISAPAERLLGLMSGIPQGSQLSIERRDNDLHVQSGRSRYRLPTLPSDEFPEMSEPREPVEFSLGCLDVRALFGEPAHPIKIDGSRIMLEGGLLHQPSAGQIAMAGTDGTCLVRRILSTDIQFDRRFIVPKHAMAEIVKLASNGDLDFRCGENLIEVTAGNRVFTSKLIEAEYPGIDRVIPAPGAQYILVDRAEFVGAFKRLIALQAENSTIDMQWRAGAGEMMMSLSGEGTGHESIVCECEVTSGSVSFAPAILGPMLEIAKGDALQLHTNGSSGALRIIDPSDEGLTIVVMPCKPRHAAVADD